MAADGTAIPPVASSWLVQGPAHTITVPAVTGPAVVWTATWRPSSLRPVTVTPGRISGTPAARARSVASALITQDSVSSRAGPSAVTRGNLAAASAAVSTSQGAPALSIAWWTVSSSPPNVSCGVGQSSRWPHSSSTGRQYSRARRASATYTGSV